MKVIITHEHLHWHLWERAAYQLRWVLLVTALYLLGALATTVYHHVQIMERQECQMNSVARIDLGRLSGYKSRIEECR